MEGDSKKTQPTLIKDKFGGSSHDVLEEEFKNSTVGLISKEEYRKNKERIDSLLSENLRRGATIERKKIAAPTKTAETSKVQQIQQKQKKALLSFGDDEEEEVEDHQQKEDEPETRSQSSKGKKVENEDEKSAKDDDDDRRKDDEALGDKLVKKKKIGKNPGVDTSFLPDDERETKMTELKKKLIEDYNKEQEIIKNHNLEVKYMYWDGTNIIKTIQVKTDTKIGIFLDMCKKELSKEHSILKTTPTEVLMCVMKEYILPHSVSFYDIISVKVNTKSGLLLDNQKKEPQPGDEEEIYEIKGNAVKIVDKRWYEKNKHIYPASTWQNV